MLPDSARLLQAYYLQVVVPYPGSDMYDHPEIYGMMLHDRDYRYYNEDMPPVFDSPRAKSDEIYKQFQYGLPVLGQAMAKKLLFWRDAIAGSPAKFWKVLGGFPNLGCAGIAVVFSPIPRHLYQDEAISET